MRKKECGLYLKASQLPWRPNNNEDFPKSMNNLKGEESLLYEPENFNSKLSPTLVWVQAYDQFENQTS